MAHLGFRALLLACVVSFASTSSARDRPEPKPTGIAIADDLATRKITAEQARGAFKALSEAEQNRLIDAAAALLSKTNLRNELQMHVITDTASVRAGQFLTTIGIQAKTRLLTHLSNPDASIRANIVFIAGRLRDEMRSRRVGHGPPPADAAFETAIAKLIDDPEAAVRAEVVHALAFTTDPKGGAALIKALQDSDARIRAAAAWGLKPFPDSREEEPIDSDESDPEELEFRKKDREHIESRLSNDERVRRCDALGELLDAEADASVRHAAVESLAALNGGAAVEILIRALSDKDELVRCGAAEGLGTLRDRSAVPALIRALDDPSEMLCVFAIRSLGQLKDPRATRSLVALLESPSQDRARAAAEALGDIGDRRAVPALLKSLAKNVKGSAYALGKLGDSSAVLPLMEALKRAEAEVIAALGNLRDARAVEPLIDLLFVHPDGDQQTLDAIGEALLKIKDPIVLIRLCERHAAAKKHGYHTLIARRVIGTWNGMGESASSDGDGVNRWWREHREEVMKAAVMPK